MDGANNTTEHNHMRTTTPQARIFQRRDLKCEVPGCYYPVRNFSKYCARHGQIAERTGDPRGKTVLLARFRPWIKAARKIIRDQLAKGHPGVTNCVGWIDKYLAAAEKPRQRLYRWNTITERANAWLANLHENGVDGVDVLATVAGMMLLRDVDPRVFVSDQHFDHQVIVRVLRLAAAPFTDSRGKQRYDRIPTKVRQYLAGPLVKSANGVMAMRIARQVLKESEDKQKAERDKQGPPRDGIHQPFQ